MERAEVAPPPAAAAPAAAAPAAAAPAAPAPADPVWPCNPRRGAPRPAGAPASAGAGRGATSYVMPASDARLDDPGSAPAYSDSWSAGLATALEKADQNRAAAATGGGADNKPKSKKGRKGKSVLISGGLNF